MDAYGIKFVNRIKSDSGDTSKNFSDFLLFAGICASRNINNHVSSVMWDGNCNAFDIKFEYGVCEGDDIWYSVLSAAYSTFDQFIIFGNFYEKHGYDID